MKNWRKKRGWFREGPALTSPSSAFMRIYCHFQALLIRRVYITDKQNLCHGSLGFSLFDFIFFNFFFCMKLRTLQI